MQSSKRIKRIVIIGLLLLLSVTSLGIITTTDFGSNIIQAAQKVKYIGKDKYQIAKKEHEALLAKKKKLVKQKNSTQSQVSDIKDQEEKAREEAAAQQAAAEKQQQEQQKATEAAKKQAQTSTNSDTSTSSSGDMNTASSGQIVGNRNSHIYHVPGQRGYNMNSSNAVYFQTEQDAINAGYRKAKV
ncbi:sunset domain-containing protein [Companilactobacillus sp. HBUAS59699]|uniref:sunset domain-containing protein n=1 Tax=Companilactobacillus sp. HBUAS59699 TaxID=3109358 RepID=UPI002FF15E74